MVLTLTGDESTAINGWLEPGEELVSANKQRTVVAVALALPLRGGQGRVILGEHRPRERDRTMIAAHRRAHLLVAREKGCPQVTVAPCSPYERRVQRLAFLAPDIQRAIVDRRQPADLLAEAARPVRVWCGIACYEDQRP